MRGWRGFSVIRERNNPGVMLKAVQKMVSGKMGIAGRQNMFKRNAPRLRRATGAA